jgi:hypothetical protein
MANAQQVAALKVQVAAYDKVDLEKVRRRGLGDESMAGDLESRLEGINRLKAIVLAHPEGVHSEPVGQAAAHFTQLATVLSQQAARGSGEYITNRQPVLSAIDTTLEEAKKIEPPFVTAALAHRGFLEDQGIRDEYQRTVADLRKETQETLDKVKTEATKAIQEAQKLAEEIEAKARRTAARVSVEEAQRQFREAQRSFDRSALVWGAISIFLVLAFFGVVFLFTRVPLPDDWKWQLIYHTALRIAALSAVGALAGYSLKTLSAYLNMRERNLHRQRVANSIEAFVVSAQTPEVRDVILSQLVDAIVSFGDSGLLAKDSDSFTVHRMATQAADRLVDGMKKS